MMCDLDSHILPAQEGFSADAHTPAPHHDEQSGLVSDACPAVASTAIGARAEAARLGSECSGRVGSCGRVGLVGGSTGVRPSVDGGVLSGSEHADGASLGIDFDVGAMGDAGGGCVSTDDRCQAELA